MLTNIKSKLYEYRIILFSIVASSLVLPIKINSILIGIYFIYWLIIVPKTEKLINLKSNKYYFLLYFLFFALNALSFFYSDNTNHAIKDIEGKLSLLILPIILFSQNSFSEKQIKQSLIFFSYIIAISALTAFVISLIKYNSILVNQEFSGLIGIHASYLGMYVAFAFFSLLHYYLIDKKKSSLLPMLILFLSLIFLSPRIILLGFIIVNIIWFVGRGINLRKVLYGFIGLVVLGALSWSFQPIKTRLIEAVNLDDKVELDTDPELHLTLKTYGGRAIRIAIWTCSQDVLKEYWLTGVGIGDVHTHLQESYKNHAFEFAWRYNNYNAHNLFIETIIAFGVLGVIILLFLFYYLFYWALKRKSLPVFAFTLLFFGLSFMESTLNVHRGVVFFAIFSPLFLAYSSNIENQ